jgi:hypothetical protein
MSGQSLWNPARGADMSSMTGVFDGMVDFFMFYTSPTHPMCPP